MFAQPPRANSARLACHETNKADYIPHHEPFQYYKSTANPTHARPTSVTSVGLTDAANLISPYSKANFVDHTVTDQTSILRFIEDNWLNSQRIGSGSFDALANSIQSMMHFMKAESKGKLILNETTGEVVTPAASAAK